METAKRVGGMNDELEKLAKAIEALPDEGHCVALSANYSSRENARLKALVASWRERGKRLEVTEHFIRTWLDELNAK